MLWKVNPVFIVAVAERKCKRLHVLGICMVMKRLLHSHNLMAEGLSKWYQPRHIFLDIISGL